MNGEHASFFAFVQGRNSKPEHTRNHDLQIGLQIRVKDTQSLVKECNLIKLK